MNVEDFGYCVYLMLLLIKICYLAVMLVWALGFVYT